MRAHDRIAPDSLFEGMVTCAACHAVSPQGAESCGECGAPLGRERVHEEAVERRNATQSELKRASAWLGGITWLYRLGALAYAVATLFAVLALARNDVPLGQGILVVCLTTLLSVLMLMYTLHILFEPFVWTLAIALLATVVSLLHYFGPNPLGVAFAGSAAWAVLSWAALAPALWARSLISQHKDLYILHHASLNTRRSLKGRSTEDRHERLLGAMRNAARRTWGVSAAAAVLLGLASAIGTYAVVSQRPQPFSDAQQAFEDAWNDRGLKAACGFLSSQIREPESSRLAGVTAGHWPDGLPRLENGATREEKDEIWVDYDLDGVSLSANWFLDDREWTLAGLELPVPPLEPVIERFRRAWARSEPRAISYFFSPENQHQMLASIDKSVQLRSWESFPDITDVQTSDYGDGRARVTMSLEEGEVKSAWYLRADGTWGLSNLEFPKREKRRATPPGQGQGG